MRCSECGEDRPLHRSEATGTDICDDCEAATKQKFQQWVATNVEAQKQRDDAKAQENIDLVMKLTHGQGVMAAVERLHELRPFFVDKNRLLWMWDATRRAWILSEDLPTRPVELVTIMKQVMKLLGDSSIKNEPLISKAIMQVGLIRRPEMLGEEWIQFGTSLYNLRTGEERESAPRFFVPNVIPWSLGEDEATPTMDRLFTEWVGAEYVTTLHELLAYTCFRNYPIHIIGALTGSGRNGKSSFLRIVRRFVGDENVASTSLDRLQTNRFETFALYNRLVALMGETDYAILETTSLLKQITGQDLVPFEKKGGSQFSGVCYSKLLLATNNLPSSNDTSEGFYRRWLIIDFSNEFPEGPDVVATIPEDEYRALARKVTSLLPALLRRNQFTNQGSIDERKSRYIAASNPLVNFIAEHCTTDDQNACTRFSLLYMKYAQWLGAKKKRVVKKKEFTTVLENEGFEIRNTSVMIASGNYDKSVYVFGISLKDQGFEFGHEKPYTGVTGVTGTFQLSSLHVKSEYESGRNARNASIAPITPEFDFPTKYDVLDALQGLQAEKQGEPVAFETVASHFPGLHETVQERLTAAAREGEAFEPRSGFWGRL